MRKPHVGRNIARLRELQGMKQESLASLLGITQQSISKLEQSENIDEERLESIAKALGVNTEVIKNFNDDAAISYFNTFNDNSTGAFQNYHCTFNPVEKIVELYERLLTSEREKIEILKGQK